MIVTFGPRWVGWLFYNLATRCFRPKHCTNKAHHYCDTPADHAPKGTKTTGIPKTMQELEREVVWSAPGGHRVFGGIADYWLIDADVIYGERPPETPGHSG